MDPSRVVLITGASSGIGEATARRFGAAGDRVAVAARRLDRLEALKEEIEAGGGRALAIQADVVQQEEIDQMVAETLEAFGRIDVLINNAGFGRFGWLENLDPEREIRAQLNVNLVGGILAARAVLPTMIAQRSGHIINMASMAGLVATPTYTVYAASKFGIRGFSQALRREVRVWGIHVSAVFPGGVASKEFIEKSGSQKRKTGIATPKWLRLEPSDVAESLYRLSRRPKSIVVLPWMMRYSVWLNNLVPSLVDAVIERRFVRPERGLD